MAPPEKKLKKAKVGAVQVIVALVLLSSMFVVFQYKVIPWAFSSFVVSLFQPTQEQQLKIGFVKFDGLVYASVSKDKEAAIKAKGEVEVSKDLINREYIFDFTFEERYDEENGYIKGANEFYAKSATLGEHAIILEPWIGFWILALVIAAIITILITMMLPTSIGFMAVLFDQQVSNTQAKIRLQTGFSDEIVNVLIMPDNNLSEIDIEELEPIFRLIWNRTVPDEMASSKSMLRFDDVFEEHIDVVRFRNESIYGRIKEYFSDFVLKEIEDSKDGLIWRRNHLFFFKGLRLYMAHHFTEKYANNVTGLAYGGAAFLIIAVGIRGLKFIPATKPSFILLAIFLEFSMLSLLAITLVYTEEEERMDKMLKKMEDANRSQLEVLRGQQHDIHQLANALVGQTAEIIKNRVENAISEYMTSSDQIERQIAEQIANKVLFSMREGAKDDKKSQSHGDLHRRW